MLLSQVLNPNRSYLFEQWRWKLSDQSQRYFKNHPLFIKSGDFNGDAISDLFAVATSRWVWFVADFNSDSIGDLAVLTKNDQSGSVVVFLKR